MLNVDEKTILLDAGHGGMIDGKYVTAPSKMHDFKDGFVFYEGVFNRKVCQRILKLTNHKPYNVVYLNRLYGDVEIDASLQKRSDVINCVYNLYKKSVLISIHGNAGGGYGGEVFSMSKKGSQIANIFEQGWNQEVKRKWRGCKEANFHMLRETNPPAILTENGFFDNRDDAEWMMSEKGINEIAKAHVYLMDNY